MTSTTSLIDDLVTANHILANEGVVDAYGHISVRHPNHTGRYLLSRSRSPELVQTADILEYHLDGTAVGNSGEQPYLERFIHGAIYESRPDVQAIVHSHAESVLPFTVCPTPLRCVLHVASGMGSDDLPVWDIADRFGDTDLLVSQMEQGRDLARALRSHSAVLMRGHGFTVVAQSLADVVKTALYMPVNARVLATATQLGGAKPLSAGEIAVRARTKPDSPQMRRAWEYWKTRAAQARATRQDAPAADAGQLNKTP
jgi:ribulose-5-phosphate 4-epimerase/fuculose-1-phosphate aldolase